MVDIVDIGLRVDSRDVKDATRSLNDLGDQSGKTQRATDGLIESLKGYASLAAIGAAIGASIQQHREFTKAISELSAITGATGQDLAFLKQQALDLGAATTFSAQEVATAFKLVASAKPELLDSKEALASVTREVLTLAEASGMTLPDAAEALGGALNQFGAGAEQANKYINILAAGSKFGASEINETAMAMKNAGAVASSLGFTFEETNAAIQALAAVSIKGGEAGTGLRGVLLKLSTQANDEFNPQIVGLTQALRNLEEANLSTAEKSKLFGQESITAATALISQADSVDQLTKSLTATNVAYEQAAINTDNLDGGTLSMNSAWSNAALLLGDTLNPALRFTVSLLADLGRAASSIVIAFRDMGDALGAYAAMAASALALDFDGIKAISEARKIQREENDAAIAKLWEEKSVVEQTAEAKKALADAEIADAMKREKIKADAIAASRRLRDEEAADVAAKAEKQRIVDDEKAAREADRRDAERLRYFEMSMEIDEQVAAEQERERAREESELAAKDDYYSRLYNLQAGSLQASYTFAQSMRAMDFTSAVQHGALMLANVAERSKKLFAVQKAFSLASALVALPSAVMQSFERGGGYPWGLIPAGLMLMHGLQQINAIKSASFGGGVAAPSIAGGGGVAVQPSQEQGLPQGATATPTAMERERVIVIEGVDKDQQYSGKTIAGLIKEIEEASKDGRTRIMIA